jgi:preprotein translocase subunit SecE
MTKDDATWLNVCYVAFACLSGFFCFEALDTLGLQTGWLERFDWWSPAATFAALILGLLFSFLLRNNKERHEYFLASISELKKVQWPTWPDTKRMTIIVVVVVGIFAAVVGVFDVAWSRVLKTLIS